MGDLGCFHMLTKLPTVWQAVENSKSSQLIVRGVHPILDRA